MHETCANIPQNWTVEYVQLDICHGLFDRGTYGGIFALLSVLGEGQLILARPDQLLTPGQPVGFLHVHRF